MKKDAGKLIASSGVKNIAAVVPDAHENGPSEFKLDPHADVTVLVYNRGIVEATHALDAEDLNKAAVAKIIADANAMLK